MTKEQLDTILDKMFEMVGADRDKIDTKKNNWFHKHSWTEEQEKEFIDWTADYLNKKAKQSKKSALKQAQWINLNYGWKVKI